MAKIEILDRQVAELIAAGEVVERPASIVKELVENCIDAGATKITVEIKGGGIKYIRVTDDGAGIMREDVKTAFVRHATSKVSTKEDLEAIMSFGFRGEALASIAAMCKVELITRTADDEVGTRYVIEGDSEGVLSDYGCPVGTTITVRDVFFNTPARLKFLKKNTVEGSNIHSIIEKIALVNTHIAFKFIKENEVVLASPGNSDLKSAIHTVLGRDFANGLLPVSYGENNITVEGYITSPQSSRATRSMQSFYINNRYIKSKTCVAALEEAFKGKLMIGKFPGAVLNISIPPNTVDVNVHPAKTEVRFSEENAVYSLIYSAVRIAIEKNAAQAPIRADLPPAKRGFTAFELQDFDYSKEQFVMTEKNQTEDLTLKTELNPINRQNINTETDTIFVEKSNGSANNNFSVASSTVEYTLKSEGVNPVSLLLKNVKKSTEESSKIDVNSTVMITAVEDEEQSTRVVGEVFSTYIIVEKGNNVIFIDKHAAHESIIYEKLKAGEMDGSQQLLLPNTVHLSSTQCATLSKFADKLYAIGLEFDIIGESTVIIRAIPTMLDEEQSIEVIKEMAQKNIRQEVLPKVIDEIYHTVACKSAIKAGGSTKEEEMRFITELLAANHSISHCPHGRPVMVEYSKSKFERMFGRNG